MIDLIQQLCRLMFEAERIESDALAAQIGDVHGSAAPNLPIVVTPRDRTVAEARVLSSPGTNEASDVVLMPAGRVTVSELSMRFGKYEESSRLHPGDPRKLVFSPGRDAEHSHLVRLIAEVSTDDAPIESAKVERVIIARATSADTATNPGPSAGGTTLWPRLLGPRASFGIRSWRAATLDSVREEIEESLGARFVPSDDKVYDGGAAFACVTPACELRLNGWPAAVGHDVTVFNLIGTPSEDLDAPPPELISEAVAAHLRSAGRDWYVPDRLELLEEGGVLGERQLERDAIVAILAPRWLAFATSAQRAVGVQLLGSIVDTWLASARGSIDPTAEMTHKRADLEAWGKGVDPERRIDILAAYAVQEQLSVVEAELFVLDEQSAGGRAPSGSVAARLDELQQALPALGEAARRLGVSSIARQYDRVEATIERLRLLVPR